MEHLYPGVRNFIDKEGLSVQAQDLYLLRTSIDQRGEQTINHDAKTSAVREIIRVLTEEYINPFDVVIEGTELFNLSSGVPLHCTDVLNCSEIGQLKFEKFTKESISCKLKPFHDPIQKTKITMFKDMTKSTKVDNNGKSLVIEANRNILDRSRLVTQKSKFVEVLSSFNYEPGAQTEMVDADIFVTDFIAQIRIITKAVSDTYEELAINFLQSIPKGYARVDLVADPYRRASIKTAERNKRGVASKPSPSQQGWTGDFEINWHDEVFLTDLEMLLLDNTDSEEEYEVGTDEESGHSEDKF
ncbi:Hypothetical predicted protein [Paramuricea clavata]|uniref:Uncharacterized protein n=1 Tax=Paramuricea clavata TaxID=317549 RepID=A0A6S7HEQ5_PARCT|nr:Hypothetical predicted protein [Paramuricea clavata]